MKVKQVVCLMKPIGSVGEEQIDEGQAGCMSDETHRQRRRGADR